MGDMNMKILNHNFSLDLSAAFDTVNVKLLLTSLRIMGLPTDVGKSSISEHNLRLNKYF